MNQYPSDPTAFRLFVYTALLLVLRLFIEPHAPVFSEVFEDRVSARWPVRMLQFKYLLPWVPAPVELGKYSLSMRILFWATRIVGTIAFSLLIGCLVAAFFADNSRHH